MPNTNTSRSQHQHVAALLSDPENTFAATLLVILVDMFGGDTLLNGEYGSLTPQTISMEVERFYNVKLPPENLGKIMAAISLETTDNITRSTSSFLATVHGLIGDGTDWAYEEPVDVDDLAWALMEATLIWPPEEGVMYDPQIVAYCQLMLSREGIKSPPSILSFAREEAAYGDLGAFDNDVLMEQADRTNDVNEYIDNQQLKLLQQLESIPSLGVTGEVLVEKINQELMEIANQDKWI
jgi:hypothetical protein